MKLKLSVMRQDLASTVLDRQKHTSSPEVNSQKKRSLRVPALIKWLLRDDKALIDAVRGRDEMKVRRLLARGSDIDATDALGYSVLNIAVNMEQETMVQLLLNENADVNGKIYMEFRHFIPWLYLITKK